MVDAILNVVTGEWECPICHRKFATHNKLRDSKNRKQFGRRWVSNTANVIRHVESCELKQFKRVADRLAEGYEPREVEQELD